MSSDGILTPILAGIGFMVTCVLLIVSNIQEGDRTKTGGSNETNENLRAVIAFFKEKLLQLVKRKNLMG